MRKFLLFFFSFFLLLASNYSHAQLVLTEQTNATLLAQKLVGPGIIISNASYTGNQYMGGFFNNTGNTNIGLDSGVVLCTGRIKTVPLFEGMDGDGVTPADQVWPDNVFGLPGDPDLSAATGYNSGDAAVLEFDMVPIGDSINFRYVFSSEEYSNDLICYFFDAFAFFISGPGISGLKNIALVPNTTTPVGNFTINDVVNWDGTDCRMNPMYFVHNASNTYFTHDGHTVVLVAKERVQPCQTYHLKLVIADLNNSDGADSGVFLEAQSLRSNSATIENLTRIDPVTGNPFTVEGCVNGSIKIKRPNAATTPQTINMTYAGTALNTIDVQTLPASVVIPANQTEIIFNITPVVDNVIEGIEKLKIYISPDVASACITIGAQITDSIEIEIRDYDTLTVTPRKANICRNGSIQLNAAVGNNTYAWDAIPGLSNPSVLNPIATPTTASTTYYCTASIGNCHARDSVTLRWKDIELVSVKDINCKNGTTGQIKVEAGTEWIAPLEFAINANAYQSDSTFNNLATGHYWIKLRDASGCLDSIDVNLVQLYPDLTANIIPSAATCSGNPDGSITMSGSGGLAPYNYSINNGANFQTTGSFNVLQGTYPILIKDFNGCTYAASQIVSLNNDLTVSPGSPVTICEGTSTTLHAVSAAAIYDWTPVTGLQNSNTADPVASPLVTTKYYVTVTKNVCTKKDSVIVTVNPAPIANAGNNITICFGGNTVLNGSGGTSYLWSPTTYLSNSTAAQPDVTRPLNDITYSLKVKDANGCNSLNTATVKVFVTAPVLLFAPRDTTAAIYQPLQLYAIDINNSGINSYLWSPAYGLNDATIARPITTLDRDQVYIVTGKTAAGCEGTATVSVKVFEGPEIYVPNAFTPNGDTDNDILRAKPIGIRTFQYFTVYNRWGKMIFTTTDYLKGWDGKVQGMEQSTGTYVWIAQGIDLKGRTIKRKGTTILIR